MRKELFNMLNYSDNWDGYGAKSNTDWSEFVAENWQKGGAK